VRYLMPHLLRYVRSLPFVTFYATFADLVVIDLPFSLHACSRCLLRSRVYVYFAHTPRLPAAPLLRVDFHAVYVCPLRYLPISLRVPPACRSFTILGRYACVTFCLLRYVVDFVTLRFAFLLYVALPSRVCCWSLYVLRCTLYPVVAALLPAYACSTARCRSAYLRLRYPTLFADTVRSAVPTPALRCRCRGCLRCIPVPAVRCRVYAGFCLRIKSGGPLHAPPHAFTRLHVTVAGFCRSSRLRCWNTARMDADLPHLPHHFTFLFVTFTALLRCVAVAICVPRSLPLRGAARHCPVTVYRWIRCVVAHVRLRSFWLRGRCR